MRYYQFVGIGLFGILLAFGCAGKGERIDLMVPIASEAGEKVVAMSSPTVAIQPFEDHRTDRSRLGTRHHLWGGESHFSLSNGTLSEATAQAFADYLKGKGWISTTERGTIAITVDGVDRVQAEHHAVATKKLLTDQRER